MLLSFFGALLKVFVGELKETTQAKIAKPQMSFTLRSFSPKNLPYIIDIDFIPKVIQDAKGKDSTVSVAHYQGVLDNQTSFTFPIPYSMEKGAPCSSGDHFKMSLEIKAPDASLSKKGEKAEKATHSTYAVIEWSYNKEGLYITSFELMGSRYCVFREAKVSATELLLTVVPTEFTKPAKNRQTG